MTLRRVRILLMALASLAFLGWSQALAQDFTVEATVDRQKVAFGETLSLSLTVTQSGSGFGTQVQVPHIDSIPGFDIIGRRSAQNVTFMQGVGRTQVQILLELVPQSPGDKQIPAFSLTSPSGEISSTHPISIKVLPPPDPGHTDPGYTEGSSLADQADESHQGMGFLRGFLWISLFLALTLAAPIFLSFILDRRRRTVGKSETSASSRRATEGTRGKSQNEPVSGVTRLDEVSDAEIVSGRSVDEPAEKPAPETSVCSPRPQIHDFSGAVEDLKRCNPEADLGFYRAYFDLFRQAYQSKHKRVLDRMTPAEIVQATVWTLGADGAGRFQRLIDDLEMTAFANTRPSRPFGAVHEDALAILRSIPPQERRS